MVRERKVDFCVNKSLSMPLSMIEKVEDECFYTGQSFSRTVVLLVKIGLSVRKQTRLEDEAEAREVLDVLKNAKQVDVRGTVDD